MSLFFVGYAQATELRGYVTIAAQGMTIILAFDLVPVMFRLEQLGKGFREEVGLRRIPLSCLGGMVFVLFWVVFWIYLAQRASISPYIYGSLGAAAVVVVVVAAIRHAVSRKRM